MHYEYSIVILLYDFTIRLYYETNSLKPSPSLVYIHIHLILTSIKFRNLYLPFTTYISFITINYHFLLNKLLLVSSNLKLGLLDL